MFVGLEEEFSLFRKAVNGNGAIGRRLLGGLDEIFFEKMSEVVAELLRSADLPLLADLKKAADLGRRLDLPDAAECRLKGVEDLPGLSAMFFEQAAALSRNFLFGKEDPVMVSAVRIDTTGVGTIPRADEVEVIYALVGKVDLRA